MTCTALEVNYNVMHYINSRFTYLYICHIQTRTRWST